jgi:14-3-3 protein epsilon
VFYYEII